MRPPRSPYPLQPRLPFFLHGGSAEPSPITSDAELLAAAWDIGKDDHTRKHRRRLTRVLQALGTERGRLGDALEGSVRTEYDAGRAAMRKACGS